MTLNFLTVFFTLLGAVLSSPMDSYQPEEAKMPIVGGYKAIKDLSEERCQSAARFAVSHLSQSPFLFESSPYEITVASGYQQVVAGMNYKLAIVLTTGSSVVGGFGVTVYDQFGTLSITNWGQELTKQQAETLLTKDFAVISERTFKRT